MAFDHRSGAATENPYAPQMGRTFVELDETGPIAVLDAHRARTLSSWVARVIPGDSEWPSADELDTVAYIDAVVRKAPELRPVLLSGIDAVDGAAHAAHGAPFTAIPSTEQIAILRDAESDTAPEAFSMILELTYEAYYRSPRVQEVVRARTGFDVTNTIVGKPMDPFPVDRLQPISSRPDRYRSVHA
jgi:hypothetical protein